MMVKGSLRALSAEEFIDVVTVGTVPAQSVFIKQPLDAAIKTNSVRGSSQPNRPSHLPVAAATEDKHSGGFENVSQVGSPLRLFLSTMLWAFWLPKLYRYNILILWCLLLADRILRTEGAMFCTVSANWRTTLTPAWQSQRTRVSTNCPTSLAQACG